MTEFRKMEKGEMARLMLQGNKLECEQGFLYFFNSAFRNPWRALNPRNERNTDNDCWCSLYRIYREPVKKWRWVYEAIDGTLQITQQRYAKKGHAEGYLGPAAVVLQKIEATEIEE